MKLLTIPKLQAALLASRLKRFVEDSLVIPINKVNLWTDSTTVCQCITKSASKQPIFITNRLSEILELTAMDQWKFVPSSLNPADCSTGVSLQTVAYPNSQFQAKYDPSSAKTCLKESEEENEEEEKEEEESRQSAATISRQIVSAALQYNFRPQVIPSNRFSNNNKLLRVFAYNLCLLQSHFVLRQTTKISHPEEYLTSFFL